MEDKEGYKKVCFSIDDHSSIKLLSANIKDYNLYYYNKRDQL